MVLDSQCRPPRAAGSRCDCHLSGLLKPPVFFRLPRRRSRRRWAELLRRVETFSTTEENPYGADMGIHPADQPLLEQQEEDSFEAWQKRRAKEAEEPWAFPYDGAGSTEAA